MLAEFNSAKWSIAPMVVDCLQFVNWKLVAIAVTLE